MSELRERANYWRDWANYSRGSGMSHLTPRQRRWMIETNDQIVAKRQTARYQENMGRPWSEPQDREPQAMYARRLQFEYNPRSKDAAGTLLACAGLVSDPWAVDGRLSDARELIQYRQTALPVAA